MEPAGSGARGSQRFVVTEAGRPVADVLPIEVAPEFARATVQEVPYLCRGPASSAGSGGCPGLHCRLVGGACAWLLVRVLCARAPSLTSVRDPRVGSGDGDVMFDGGKRRDKPAWRRR